MSRQDPAFHIYCFWLLCHTNRIWKHRACVSAHSLSNCRCNSSLPICLVEKTVIEAVVHYSFFFTCLLSYVLYKYLLSACFRHPLHLMTCSVHNCFKQLIFTSSIALYCNKQTFISSPLKLNKFIPYDIVRSQKSTGRMKYNNYHSLAGTHKMFPGLMAWRPARPQNGYWALGAFMNALDGNVSKKIGQEY